MGQNETLQKCKACIEMKNEKIFDFLKQLMIAAVIIYLTPALAAAQNLVPPPSVTETPPPDEPGNNADGAMVPSPPNSGNSFSEDNYESVPDPFRRGCPFDDQELQLVS